MITPDAHWAESELKPTQKQDGEATAKLIEYKHIPRQKSEFEGSQLNP